MPLAVGAYLRGGLACLTAITRDLGSIISGQKRYSPPLPVRAPQTNHLQYQLGGRTEIVLMRKCRSDSEYLSRRHIHAVWLGTNRILVIRVDIVSLARDLKCAEMSAPFQPNVTQEAVQLL